ncbi:MAG: ABC transporter ATP-binding protein [Promethearchaeota archaeon]
MVEVRLEDLNKRFHSKDRIITAVDNVNLSINEGEIVTLLGPSGCGKSTTLRIIAGFITPDSGKVYFGEEDITNLPPRKRNTGMVFQSYALWPHMSVRKNVEYGLVIRKIPREQRVQRIKESLRMVDMEEFIDASPTTLSGGQQQRIAVARALVINPDVLLLDEPLSNLDAKLRVETRTEIRSLVKELNLTAIFVTHDQAEALAISDRIAVMNTGALSQVGNPIDIYENPENSFVATFIGEANKARVIVVDVLEDHVILEIDGKKGLLKANYFKYCQKGKKADIVIRPEHISLFQQAEGENILECQVESSQYMGNTERTVIEIAGYSFVCQIEAPDFQIHSGQRLFAKMSPDHVMAFGDG